jgi:hypothetical protein
MSALVSFFPPSKKRKNRKRTVNNTIGFFFKNRTMLLQYYHGKNVWTDSKKSFKIRQWILLQRKQSCFFLLSFWLQFSFCFLPARPWLKPFITPPNAESSLPSAAGQTFIAPPAVPNTAAGPAVPAARNTAAAAPGQSIGQALRAAIL